MKFRGNSKRVVVEEYIAALEWIINYYTSDITSWGWYYPYFYAPFLSDVSNALLMWEHVEEKKMQPVSPYEQLLMIFPGRSIKAFLPKEFGQIPDNLCKYYPKKFEIDLQGTFREWEGISLIPFMDRGIISKWYRSVPDHIRNSAINTKHGVPKIFSH